MFLSLSRSILLLIVSTSDAGQQLVVSSINKLDEGSYQCQASNQYGSARSSPVYVTVIGN